MLDNVGYTSWLQLQGRTCVVTGAASGIGRSIAQELVQQGARVAVMDKNVTLLEQTVSDLRAHGGQVLAVPCDITDEAQLNTAAKQIVREMGAVQTLINNAGVLRPGSLDQLTLQDWNLVLSVDLTGYWLTTKVFGEQLRSHREQGGKHRACGVDCGPLPAKS